MSYIDVFETIVDIIKIDYSGFESKKGWGNDSLYRSLIKKEESSETLTRECFKRYVDDYLLDFKDFHIKFIDKQNPCFYINHGIKTRRYEDMLYITEAHADTDLQKGMKIKAIDNVPITELSSKWEKHLLYQPHERQVWDFFLDRFNTLTVLHEGKELYHKLEVFPPEPDPDYSFERISHDTVMLKFHNFENQRMMDALIENHSKDISQAKNLIIDVRYNSGGSDSVYGPLKKYIFPKGTVLEELPDDDSIYFNMTERNHISRTNQIKGMLEQGGNEDFLNSFLNFMDENKGSGLVERKSETKSRTITGSSTPEKVIVLTDRYCGSSGDAFVRMAKKSPKVTVVGRNTCGVIDYSNLALAPLEEDFMLFYPTSVLKSALEGRGIDNIGVDVDIHIPWTPDHINEDIDLKRALEMI